MQTAARTLRPWEAQHPGTGWEKGRGRNRSAARPDWAPGLAGQLLWVGSSCFFGSLSWAALSLKWSCLEPCEMRWPGLFVCRYRFIPQQQSVLMGGEHSEQLWSQLRRCQHESPPSGGLRPHCFTQRIDFTREGNGQQGRVASQTHWTGKGFRVICFHSLRGPHGASACTPLGMGLSLPTKSKVQVALNVILLLCTGPGFKSYPCHLFGGLRQVTDLPELWFPFV